ncbi:phosphopentomutase [Yersinia nurmii]|uniref:Mutase n=1 Tax=Yersinia nurmii TaxID=685706 RepID=A0AAW7K7W0_9GAMM|nr:phosphopentomutase [Yersinia nurmii]MDN0087575.1 phosphopentomutase [Yersinia nurmii]CNF17506.1 putative mutase [Yersinia nurmii]
MSKFMVLVIDSFGIGEMPDVPLVRPQDIGANTCGHILETLPELYLPTLEKLGLINTLGYTPNLMQPNPSAAFGRMLLQHEGGDTFIGHQEIMGTLPLPPLSMPFSAVIDNVAAQLTNNGYQVERITLNNLSYLWVNQGAAIGDNLEADLGQVYNISADFNRLSFEQVLAIGQLVRETVKVGRVIAFGGDLPDTADLLRAAESREGKYIGINAPNSGVYRHNFRVAHLGYGVDERVQAPAMLWQRHIPTVLIGKVADIVSNANGINYAGIVDSQTILDIMRDELLKPGDCFICTNIQETDLAGHQQDTLRYADRLQLVDSALNQIMAAMQPDDILVVIADHGNDPTIGHGKHTREQVPLLVYQRGLSAVDLGTRRTLSDVGATACAFFSAPMPQNGQSFLTLLRPSVSRSHSQ